MATEPVEKRRDPRTPLVLRVAFADRPAAVDATENLSKRGLFVQTRERFAIGEQVALSLSFPGLVEPVTIQGRVVWLRPAEGGDEGGVGIRAEGEQDRRRLEGLLGQAAAEGEAAKRPPSEGYRVLIVEDNPHIVEMYSYVLKKLAAGELKGKVPLEVHFAADGHHALQQLAGRKFHLVLTDLYMPVMDGFALIEKIRGQSELRAVPVVAISAGGKDAQERALNLGVDIFLRKPVKFVEVLDTVKHLLGIR